MPDIDIPSPLPSSSCRNCRRPIEWVGGVGWVHGEHPRYAADPITCAVAHPVECRHHMDAACPLTPEDGHA